MKSSFEPGSLYRAKLIGQNGEVAKTFSVLLHNKREAVAQVRNYTEGFKLEIWEGDRLVARSPDRTH
jgi:hypothetical protein